MHIKGGYLTNLFLKTDSPLSGANIPWRQGELVTGFVDAVKGNGLVQLIVRGTSLEAQTEIPLSVGQRLSLYVNEVRPGYVHLRVLTPEVVAALEQQKLASVLTELGIKPDDKTVALAAKLIQHQLPVDRENVTRLLRTVSLLGAEDPRTMEIGAWIMSRKIDVLPEHMLVLKEFLISPNNLALLLSGVRERLRAIAKGQNAVQEENDVSRPVVWPPKGGLVEQGQGPSVVTTPGRSGTIGRYGLVDSGAPTALDVKLSLPLLDDIINRFVEAVTLQVEETGSPSPAEVKRVIENQPDAGRALATLEQVLANYLPEPENGSVEQVLDRLKAARYELEGQHLFNVLNNLPRENTQLVFYLAFPVSVGQEYHLCELKVMKDGSGKRDRRHEKGEFSLVLSLSTGTLGVVLFHVTYYPKNTLILQAVVENSRVGTCLQAGIPELTAGLERLGFNVKGCGVKVVDSGQRALRPGLVEVRETRCLPGVDIVV